MKTVSEIRLENLTLLLSELGSLRALADKANTSASYLSQIKNGLRDSKSGTPKSVGSSLARQLEEGCGKPRGWMDEDHSLRAEETVSEYKVQREISPRMRAFIDLIESLPESEQRALFKTLEAKKQHFDQLFDEMSRARSSSAGG